MSICFASETLHNLHLFCNTALWIGYWWTISRFNPTFSLFGKRTWSLIDFTFPGIAQFGCIPYNNASKQRTLCSFALPHVS